MKKILASLLCVMMVFCMMPGMAWAETTTKTLTVSDADAWNTAKSKITDEAGSSDLVIDITASGTYTTNFSIPGGKNITIQGTDDVVLNGQIAALSTGTLTMKNLVYNVDDNINDCTKISQTGATAIAVWNDEEVICQNVTFNMRLSDSTAITAWWSIGDGANITAENCTFNCNGQRPIRSDASVSVRNCTFNDPYRYAVQLTSKASTISAEGNAAVNFYNNSINAGTTASGKPVYGVQLEGETYGCSNLTVNGSGNVIHYGETGKSGAMYYCECGKVDHNSIAWNTETAPVHASESFDAVAAINGVQYVTLSNAIAAVPSGIDNATTIKLLKNADGGIIIGKDSAKNIIIDLNGYTYDVKKSVGSTGTETNGMQLLKGSIVTLKNGAMKNTTASTKIYIKNYANLTLEDIIIDGSNVGSTIINNCGQLVIQGEKTNISSQAGTWTVTTGNYHHGDIITTEINEGTISSVACETPLWETGGATVEESVTTTINGGKIGKIGEYDWRAEYGGSYLNAPLLTNWKMNIKGGTFDTQVADKYIVEGFNQYKKDDGTYIVAASNPRNSSGKNSWVKGEDGIYTEVYIPISTPSTPTDNVINSGTAGTDNATTSADLSNTTTTTTEGGTTTTTATVDKETADKIVDKAVENKSEEVVIDATANTSVAAGSATAAQVEVPTTTLEAIAEKTEADVTVKTDVAEVTLDNAAVGAVAEQAAGDTVQLTVEKVEENADKVEFELKIVSSEGKVISDFKGGNVSVTVTVPKTMAEKEIVCVYIDENGRMSKVKGQKNADGTYTFITGHFSTYALMTAEEAETAIAAQNDEIQNTKITLHSQQVKMRNGKKAIKLTWTCDSDVVFDGVEIYRSTKRYSGFGKKPLFSTTNNAFYNTSVKAGTKYYYKVRGYVEAEGEKIYTDYSTKAWRTVK